MKVIKQNETFNVKNCTLKSWCFGLKALPAIRSVKLGKVLRMLDRSFVCLKGETVAPCCWMEVDIVFIFPRHLAL